MDQYTDDRVALLYKILIFACLKFFSFLELYKYFLIFLYFIWYIIFYFFFAVTVKMRDVVDSAMLNKRRNDNANDGMQGNKKVKECALASLPLRKAP